MFRLARSGQAVRSFVFCFPRGSLPGPKRVRARGSLSQPFPTTPEIVAAGEKGEARARRGSRVFCKGKKISLHVNGYQLPPTVAVIHVVGAPISHPWSQCPLAGGRWTKPSYQPWPSETSASRSRTAVVDIPIGDLVFWHHARRELPPCHVGWKRGRSRAGAGQNQRNQAGSMEVTPCPVKRCPRLQSSFVYRQPRSSRPRSEKVEF